MKTFSFLFLLLLSFQSTFASIISNKSFINFGNIHPEETKYDSVILTNTGSDNVTIADILTEGSAFSIEENNCPQILEPNKKCVIVLSFSDNQIGSYNGNLKIFTDKTTLSINLDGSVVGNKSIALSNSFVDFGIIPIGKKKTKTIYIRNDGDVPVTIIGIDGIEAPYSVSLNEEKTLQPKDIIPINITFSPTDNGEYNQNIKILVDDPNLTKTIYLKGKAVENDIDALCFFQNDHRISELNFGNVFLLDSKQETVTIDNPTLKNIEITEIKTPVGYSVSPSTFNIPSFSNATIEVTFSPNKKRVYSGYISLITSDKNVISIPVIGEGVDFKFSSSKGEIVSYKLSSLPVSYSKPKDVVPLEVIGFSDYNFLPEKKIHINLKLFASYSKEISFYKLTSNGNWIKLPTDWFNNETKELQFDIYDNSNLDLNHKPGIIQDPIVIAIKASPIPEAQSGKGTNGGGGCSIASATSVSSGMLNLLLTILGIAIPFAITKTTTRRTQ